MAELEALRSEKAALEARVKAFAASDPVELAALHAKARVAKAAADRWTDNIFTLKAKLQRDMGREPAAVDAMLGIDDNFDYVQ